MSPHRFSCPHLCLPARPFSFSLWPVLPAFPRPIPSITWPHNPLCLQPSFYLFSRFFVSVGLASSICLPPAPPPASHPSILTLVFLCSSSKLCIRPSPSPPVHSRPETASFHSTHFPPSIQTRQFKAREAAHLTQELLTGYMVRNITCANTTEHNPKGLHVGSVCVLWG